MRIVLVYLLAVVLLIPGGVFASMQDGGYIGVSLDDPDDDED